MGRLERTTLHFNCSSRFICSTHGKRKAPALFMAKHGKQIGLLPWWSSSFPLLLLVRRSSSFKWTSAQPDQEVIAPCRLIMPQSLMSAFLSLSQSLTFFLDSSMLMAFAFLNFTILMCWFRFTPLSPLFSTSTHHYPRQSLIPRLRPSILFIIQSLP